MTTLAPPLLLALARRIEDAIPSAVFSGIVPDASHTWGFHLSPEDLGWNRGDYSLANDDNWAGAKLYPQWAAAFDMSMSPSDMTLVHGRIRASWADPNDNRLSLWYEHIGAINGVVSRLVSYEPEWGEFFDADGTHTWHEHTSARRSQLNNQHAMDALYGVWTGKKDGMTIPGAYDDYLPDTVMAMLVGQTPRFGYPETTGPSWDNEAVTRHNLKAVEERLTARIDQLAAAMGRIQLTDEQVKQLAAAIAAAPDTPLTEADIPAIAAGVKRALREGVG